MRGKKNTFSAALWTLQRQRWKAKPAPASPSELTLGSIKQLPQVFQHRQPHPSDTAAHVRGLTAATQRNRDRKLTAITIWWDGRNWVCIDGHHRLKAYAKVLSSTDKVPVQVFSGSLDEALAEAAAGNTCDKMPMTASEKMNAAWRLTCTTELSKAQVVKACGVSEGSVSKMRRVFSALGEQADCADLSWFAAQRQAEGKRMPEKPEHDEDWMEAKASELALQMRKALPRGFENQPDVFMRALEILHPKLLVRLREEFDEEGEATENENF